MREADVVDLLLARSGRPMRIIATDGEPMIVRILARAEHPENREFLFFVKRGGIPLSADGGRYFFYSNEVARVEDVETGEVVLARRYD